MSVQYSSSGIYRPVITEGERLYDRLQAANARQRDREELAEESARYGLSTRTARQMSEREKAFQASPKARFFDCSATGVYTLKAEYRTTSLETGTRRGLVNHAAPAGVRW